MKGLLKNNFYGAIGNIKAFLFIDFILIMLLLVTGNETLLYMVSLPTTPFLALLAASCLLKEGNSKWGKHKLAFPVTRRNIVKSQFISHLLWTMLGTIIVITVISLTVIIHGNQYFHYNFRDAVAIVLVGNIIALLIGSLVYPMLYLGETERAEVVLAISVILSIGILFGLSMLINSIVESPLSDIQFYRNMSVEVMIAVIVYMISYFLTVDIFRKKEF